MTTLIIATRNAHKVEEIRSILGIRFHFATLRDFPEAPVAVEDENTFAGNATKKAVELSRWLRSRPENSSSPQFNGSAFVLADDSGLEVDALNGAPGVHSARFAAPELGVEGNSPDMQNNAKLLRLLENVPAGGRAARFRCVLALTPVHSTKAGSESTMLFDGTCDGRIARAPSGGQGFGYDPLFVPEGLDQSFADLSDAAKNQISHRARALEKLHRWFESGGVVTWQRPGH